MIDVDIYMDWLKRKTASKWEILEVLNELERKVNEMISPIIVKSLLDGPEVDMCSIIAADRGWLPLRIGEKMTVHYGGKEYEITRKE